MFKSTGGTNNELRRFLPFCNHLKQMNRFLALLGQPSLSVFSSLPAQNEHCFKDHNDFYFSVLLPLFFLGLSCCTAKEARPWQYQYKSTVNMLEVLVTPVHVSQPNPSESGFHASITLYYIPPPISHLVVALSPFLFTGISELLYHINFKFYRGKFMI